jgi:hypothetical protein
MMIVVMLPLFMTLRLPWRQKLSLMCVFGLGTFVIVAALLNKIFNLTDVYSTVYMLWYVREASTAVYVSNIPLIWPLLREWFPYLRHLTPGHAPSPSGSSPKGGSIIDHKGSANGHVLSSLEAKVKGLKNTSSGTTSTNNTGPDGLESREPMTTKLEDDGVLEEIALDDNDSVKDLERGIIGGRCGGRTGHHSRKDSEVGDYYDFLASIAAGNARGRLEGQSWETKR